MNDNNNNNTRMEYVDEKEKSRREKLEKLEITKRKFSEKIDIFKSNMVASKQRREEKKRIKEQQKAMQQTRTSNKTQSSYQEHTVTNETIMNNNQKKKIVLTDQEKRQRKEKRKRIFRNIMTIPEIILIVLLILFLKDKYIAYSKNVHQTLIYKAEEYEYEIKRDNNDISVIKRQEIACKKSPCEKTETDKYQVKFSKKQMLITRVYFDVTFFFKSKKKEVNYDKLNSDIGKRTIRGIIHNDSKFLNTKLYDKYKVVDYEQMGNYEERGFIYEAESGKYYLTIALGEKPTGGYSIVVPEIHKTGDDLMVYFTEQKPGKDDTTTQIITHPSIKIELEERPGEIRVKEIDTGEELMNYDDKKFIKK